MGMHEFIIFGPKYLEKLDVPACTSKDAAEPEAALVLAVFALLTYSFCSRFCSTLRFPGRGVFSYVSGHYVRADDCSIAKHESRRNLTTTTKLKVKSSSVRLGAPRVPEGGLNTSFISVRPRSLLFQLLDLKIIFP